MNISFHHTIFRKCGIKRKERAKKEREKATRMENSKGKDKKNKK